MIAIINYGMGNLRSVQKAFERLKVHSEIIADPLKLNEAKKIVLPGVGHFANGMRKLKDAGWIDALKEEVLGNEKPLIGICLGMQLLTNHSEEGDVEGLGFVDASTIAFTDLPAGMKIPHMGWNGIIKVKDSKFLEGLDEKSLFYFVHSYYVKCNSPADALCQSVYGIEFTSGIQKGHISGFQFHPEKSHSSGLRLLSNYINQ